MSLQVKKITDALSVAGQITLGDIATIKARGFRTLINNRPDREEKHQPRSASLAAEARRQDLSYISLPVISGSVKDSDVRKFEALLDKECAPVLAFCRTGTRCATLWALSEAKNDTTDSILARAEEAGYDLSALAARINEYRLLKDRFRKKSRSKHD